MHFDSHDYRAVSSLVDAKLYREAHAFWRQEALATHEATGANMTFTIQPITRALVSAGHARGGNPLGLPSQDHQCQYLVATFSMPN